MRKKIVTYFHHRTLSSDPFATFGEKRSVYHEFFKAGIDAGFDMYVASGKNNYLGKLQFKNTYTYNGTSFDEVSTVIDADAVFDRSGGMSFPPQEIGTKTLNCIQFKKLCHDKNLMQELLGEYMPMSFPIKNQQELLEKILLFKNRPLLVLKPATGMQGKGIIIDSPEKIAQTALEKDATYVIQEFVDTSSGILTLTPGYHDLRVVVLCGNILFCHIRTPQAGSLLANVALGGSIQEVSKEELPTSVLSLVKKVQKILDYKFDSPLYSIDIGVQNQTQPFIFELNDQIGFPSERMLSRKDFIDGVINSLSIKANI